MILKRQLLNEAIVDMSDLGISLALADGIIDTSKGMSIHVLRICYRLATNLGSLTLHAQLHDCDK